MRSAASGVAFGGSSLMGVQLTHGEPGGDMRKFFVGDGEAWWGRRVGRCECEGHRLAVEDVEGGAWARLGGVSVGACGAWRRRADALAGGAADLDAGEAQFSSLGGVVFVARRLVDRSGEREV